MDLERRAVRGAVRCSWMTVAMALVTCAIWSCTPGQKLIAKTVLDVADFACITAKAELDSADAIAEACNVTHELVPSVKTVIDDFKAKRESYARQKMSAARCEPAK